MLSLLHFLEKSTQFLKSIILAGVISMTFLSNSNLRDKMWWHCHHELYYSQKTKTKRLVRHRERQVLGHGSAHEAWYAVV